MGRPVVHFEIHTHQDERLRSFYSDLFGWRLGVVPDGSYALVDTDAGGEGIRGGIAASRDGVEGVMFYIAVDDIERELERIQVAGGRTLVGRSESAQVTTALFADPDGNTVGLVQRPGPGTPLS